MTLRELLLESYRTLDANAPLLLVAAAATPIGGTLLARIGKAGRTDKDGRFIASAIVGIGILALLCEVIALYLAHRMFGADPASGNVLLLVAPIVCLAGCIAGIRWVFPLSELASVRTGIDIGAFLLACAVAIWLLGKFRGWGIVFFGSIVELAAIGIFAFRLLRHLYRRAAGHPKPLSSRAA